VFKRILLAHDGSSFGAAALRQSAELALLAGAELHMLGIVVTTGYMALAEGNGAIDVWGLERRNLQPALDAAMEQLTARGIKVIPIVREGEPSEEIIAYARAISADLVVIGHTKQGMIARWLQGSVGSRLVGNLSCSLLIATNKV
jgi:nucleotide-binding universal stress UspA family protein